jgi:hypothetical protein
METEIKLEADASLLQECLDALFADLADAPHHVRKLALDLFNIPSELVSVEQGIATGACVPLLFKPSQRLLDFRAAVRTRDFDHIVV